MKKIILTFFIFSCISSFAQKKAFNQFSIEANYGLSLPVTPIPDGRKAGEFNGFTNFSIGARYMFLSEIGVQASYSHDKFQDSRTKSNDLVYNGFNIQAVSNLVSLFKFKGDFWEEFGLLAHTGGGITYANTEAVNNERVGTIIFGATPLYSLSQRLALSLDFAYNITLKQHFGYDGKLIEPDFAPSDEFESFTGGFFNIAIGLKYYIGNRGDHADWQ